MRTAALSAEQRIRIVLLQDTLQAQPSKGTRTIGRVRDRIAMKLELTDEDKKAINWRLNEVTGNLTWDSPEEFKDSSKKLIKDFEFDPSEVERMLADLEEAEKLGLFFRVSDCRWADAVERELKKEL